MFENACWYAVQETTEDDWGIGSYLLKEAIQMANNMGCRIIAVIENDCCVQELYKDVDF